MHLPWKEEKGVAAKDPSLAHFAPTTRGWHASKADDNRLDNDEAFMFATIVDDEVMECFLNFPDVDPKHPFALDYSSIANTQKDDPLLQSKLRENHTVWRSRHRQ